MRNSTDNQIGFAWMDEIYTVILGPINKIQEQNHVYTFPTLFPDKAWILLNKLMDQGDSTITDGWL